MEKSALKLSSLTSTTTTTTSGGGGYGGYGCPTAEVGVGVISDQFPIGLRVLVVDDDTTCLKILEQMLRKCLYHVMSADGRTSAVMRGIKHGACDYLIKPVRLEELKNIWQHVIRKKWNGSRDLEQSGSMEDTGRHKRGGDDIEYASSANEGTDGSWRVHKKRKDAKEEVEDEGDLDNDDPSTSKKPRVVWSVELHQQFVSAVNQLGIDKAVPKRILELMNVPGLSRENVASHLQKFRLYLKRLSKVAQQQSGIPSMYYGSSESNAKLGSLTGVDIQALAASGQIPSQTLAALHAEVFGRQTGSLAIPAMDKSVLLQSSFQGAKCIPVERGVTFGQPIGKCQSHISKHSPQSSVTVEDIPSGFGTWLPNNLSVVGSMGNQGGLNTQNNNMLRQILQQQQHHQSVLPESSHTINVQPSCLVVPSHSPSNSQAGNISVPFNQSSTFSSSSLVDYNFISSQPHNASVGLGQDTDADLKNTGVLNGYCVPGSISSSMPSCLGRADNVSSWQVQNSTMNVSAATKLQGPNMWDVQGIYTSKRGDLPNQDPGMNLGFVGKGTTLPSRFAIDDFELPMGNLSHGKTYGDNDGGEVKQELNLEYTENAKVGSLPYNIFLPPIS